MLVNMAVKQICTEKQVCIEISVNLCCQSHTNFYKICKTISGRHALPHGNAIYTRISKFKFMLSIASRNAQNATNKCMYLQSENENLF